MREVSVLGVVYRVVDDVEIEGGAEGECVHEAAEIRVAKGIAKAKRPSVLAHEIAHAVSFESGFRQRMRRDQGLREDTAIAIEEAMLEHFVPVLLDTLSRNGWRP
jgi:hypothetical protein